MKKMKKMKKVKKKWKKNIEHKNQIIGWFFHKNQNPVLMPKSGSQNFFPSTHKGLIATPPYCISPRPQLPQTATPKPRLPHTATPLHYNPRTPQT